MVWYNPRLGELLNQALPNRFFYQADHRTHTGFAEHITPVRFHCRDRNSQLLRNLPGSQFGGNQVQDVGFAGCQHH